MLLIGLWYCVMNRSTRCLIPDNRELTQVLASSSPWLYNLIGVHHQFMIILNPNHLATRLTTDTRTNQ